jgi:hemerythrin superfamily protein
MDAITLLKNDHKTVEQLFKRFEKAGDRAHVEKRRIVDRIIEELSVHAAIEEQCFYPMAREAVPSTEDVALESLEEHHVVKWLLSELDAMDPEAERFDAKVTVLMEMVRHHVEEEETEFFPKVREALGRSDLAELGAIMTEAKKSAPTHPHPEAPDSPPANGLVGAISGAGDRIADQINGVAQGAVTAVRDLAARVTGGTLPTTRPTGSSVTRSTAQKVRRVADAATDAVEETARSVATNSRTTARSAKSGAKRTAATAKRAASKTRAVAKSSAR